MPSKPSVNKAAAKAPLHSVKSAKAGAKAQRSLVPVIAVSAAVIAAGFTAAWLYFKQGERLEKQRIYSKPHEVAIAVKDYTVAATFSVRTNGKHAEWAGSQGAVMEDIVKESLMNASPKRILTPEGMREFQDTLRRAINARAESNRVQEVLITDFLFSPDSN
jgi:flagellar basal body-associated protein FliL